MALKVCRVARDIYVDPTMDGDVRLIVENAIGVDPSGSDIDGRFIKKDQIVTVQSGAFTKVNTKWPNALVEFDMIVEADLS